MSTKPMNKVATGSKKPRSKNEKTIVQFKKLEDIPKDLSKYEQIGIKVGTPLAYYFEYLTGVWSTIVEGSCEGQLGAYHCSSGCDGLFFSDLDEFVMNNPYMFEFKCGASSIDYSFKNPYYMTPFVMDENWKFDQGGEEDDEEQVDDEQVSDEEDGEQVEEIGEGEEDDEQLDEQFDEQVDDEQVRDEEDDEQVEEIGEGEEDDEQLDEQFDEQVDEEEEDQETSGKRKRRLDNEQNKKRKIQGENEDGLFEITQGYENNENYDLNRSLIHELFISSDIPKRLSENPLNAKVLERENLFNFSIKYFNLFTRSIDTIQSFDMKNVIENNLISGIISALGKIKDHYEKALSQGEEFLVELNNETKLERGYVIKYNRNFSTMEKFRKVLQQYIKAIDDFSLETTLE